jgi:hypothetical protein
MIKSVYLPDRIENYGYLDKSTQEFLKASYRSNKGYFSAFVRDCVENTAKYLIEANKKGINLSGDFSRGMRIKKIVFEMPKHEWPEEKLLKKIRGL